MRMNGETVQLLAALAIDLPVATLELTKLGLAADGDPRLVTGVHVTFANGFLLSVQWHRDSYSSVGRGQDGEPTFAVAAFYPGDGGAVDLTGLPMQPDAGWCSVAEVVEYARNVSAMECL